MNKDSLFFGLIICFAIILLTLAILDPFDIEPIYAQQSNVEIGKNYNTELIQINPDGSRTYKWTSTTEKILDYYDDLGNPVYVQSKFYDAGLSINFESMGNSWKFVKNDCTLLGYDGGKITGAHTKTLSHTIKSALNGTDIWSDESVNDELCSYQMNDNQIIVTKSNYNPILQIGSSYDVVYDFNADGSMEFTYQTTNNDFTKTDQKYGFTFVCNGIDCNDIQIDNQLVVIGETKEKSEIIDKDIRIGKGNIDLKNDQHDATWSLKHPEENKLVIDFTHSKGRLEIGDTLTIDPVFSGTASYAGYVKGDTSCTSGDEGFTTTQMYIAKAKSPYNDCQRSFAEWAPDGIDDLTSTAISDSTVTLSFTQPNLNGGTFTNYQINATTPQTANPQTFAINTTSTSPTITGLLGETSYSIRVSVLSQVGYSITGNILNFTTHGIPIITLTGYNPQIIELGLGYAEQGATTDTGSPVIIDSTSFMDIVGDYLIYYDSFNAAGNSTQIIRDVSVYDGYTINFTTGNIDVNATNPLNIDTISYEKISTDDENITLDNSVIVTVDYPNFYDFNCDIHYKFANTNSNYTSINGTILTTYTNQVTFNFTNLSNEVITLYCYDSITGEGSIYVVSNDNFPLLQMIDDFRDGVFGTESKIGYLDGITLLVIIVSMVGFNRRDAKVGIILNIMIMGVAGFYGIIQVETIMFGALATVAMFAIFSARKRQ